MCFLPQITLYFRPPVRIRQFVEDFKVRVAGVERTLFKIQGACLGTELTFATDSMPFPPVVLGSQATKRLQVQSICHETMHLTDGDFHLEAEIFSHGTPPIMIPG